MSIAKDNTIQPVGLIRNELEIPIAAPAVQVWKAMTEEIDNWWNEEFYFTKEPRTIQLEARLGGRLYEQGSDGSGLIWYHVVAIDPGKTLTLAGPFAPPYAGPAYATLHLALEPRGDEKTLFRMSESVFGHIHEGMKSSLEDGWKLLFQQGLKAHVERAG
jgi:uncharacterized protein YndB with AHSA1/START domain